MKKYAEIDKICYAGPKDTDPFSFKYYDPDEVIAGKKMRDHLKFAMSDRVMVVHEGVVQGFLANLCGDETCQAEATQENIMILATGGQLHE